jgi:hypothetical protein
VSQEIFKLIIKKINDQLIGFNRTNITFSRGYGGMSFRVKKIGFFSYSWGRNNFLGISMALNVNTCSTTSLVQYIREIYSSGGYWDEVIPSLGGIKKEVNR